MAVGKGEASGPIMVGSGKVIPVGTNGKEITIVGQKIAVVDAVRMLVEEEIDVCWIRNSGQLYELLVGRGESIPFGIAGISPVGRKQAHIGIHRNAPGALDPASAG